MKEPSMVKTLSINKSLSFSVMETHWGINNPERKAGQRRKI
jgi:hypothetical protein